MKVKTRVHQILEVTEEHDRTAMLVMALITGLIIFSVASVILESVSSINQRFAEFFFAGEVVTVFIFTIEYALRLWSCTEDPRYGQPVFGRLRYALTFFAIIDLLAFLPFYLPLVVVVDTRYLRVLRLLRIFRVAKLGRYSDAFALLGRVVRRQKEALFVTVLTIFVLIIIASSLMWSVETEAQPGNFASIPDAMWWAVATITTVGYGDVVPITPIGRLLGGLVAILGVMTIALPAGIIVSGFIDERNGTKGDAKRYGDEAERRLELLERLAGLRDRGVLSQEEFEREKAKLLRSDAPGNSVGGRK